MEWRAMRGLGTYLWGTARQTSHVLAALMVVSVIVLSEVVVRGLVVDPAWFWGRLSPDHYQAGRPAGCATNFRGEQAP